MEHEEEQAQQQADELEAKADELEERKDEFGDEVEDVKEDWEQKQQASTVPGAQDEDGTGEEIPADDQDDEGGDDAGT